MKTTLKLTISAMGNFTVERTFPYLGIPAEYLEGLAEGLMLMTPKDGGQTPHIHIEININPKE